MAQPAAQLLEEVLRTEKADDGKERSDDGRDADRNRRSRFAEEMKERARREVRQQTDLARDEVGQRAFELLEEYFPEQARSRRRRDRAQTLVVGIAIGILLRQLAGR